MTPLDLFEAPYGIWDTVESGPITAGGKIDYEGIGFPRRSYPSPFPQAASHLADYREADSNGGGTIFWLLYINRFMISMTTFDHINEEILESAFTIWAYSEVSTLSLPKKIDVGNYASGLSSNKTCLTTKSKSRRTISMFLTPFFSSSPSFAQTTPFYERIRQLTRIVEPGPQPLFHPEHQLNHGRRLAAIMFSDIVGYTTMTQNNEALAMELLEEHRRTIEPIFLKLNGHIVKTIGDAYLVEFASALDAVDCAVKVQQALNKRNSEVTPVRRVEVRIGIHAGDIIVREGDIYGDAVNIASRIEKLADPGGVAISSAVYEQVKSKIGYSMEEMGRFNLKNVEGPMLVYRVLPVGSSAQKSGGDKGKGRIGVLPLLNIGESASDDFLADGLTEELISCLSVLSKLKVIARTTMMKYKDTKKSISEIGSELGVSTVLEGSVRRVANRIRVTVQLVDTSKEETLWAQNFNREVGDVLEIQQEIAEKAVESLKDILGKGAQQIERLKVTSSSEAYVLYLEGRYHLAKHTQTEVVKALELFRKATEIDPEFASAYAMMAQCHLFLGFFGFISPQEGFEKAKPLLSKALELDSDQYVAHMLMGRYLIDREWDWVGAEAEYRRAIELNPSSAEAHYRYGLLLQNQGRHEEAVAEAKMAEELDPLSVSVTQVYGTILYYARRYGEAILILQRALEIDPGAALAHCNIGLAYFQTGEVERGLAEVKKAIELDPNNEIFKVDLCYIYTKMGMMYEAYALIADAEKRSSHGHVFPIVFAGMYACLGRTEESIRWLEEAYQQHSPYLSAIKIERWFDPLRKDVRFNDINRRMNLA